MSVLDGLRRAVALVAALVRSVDNLLNVALLPGIVTHELAHALACRLVGVEVREVVLFDWSLAEIRDDQPFTARVTHAPAETVWQSTAVGGAPLVVNAAGALLAFVLVKAVLAPELLAPGLGAAVDAYGTAFATAGPLGTLLALAGAWVGLALSLTAIPSVNDALVSVEPGAGDADGGADDASAEDGHDAGADVPRPLVAVGVLLENFQSELGVVLATVLAAVGLVGPDLAVSFWRSYLAVFAVGVAYVLVRQWRRPGRSVLELPTAESQRAERVRKRVDAGGDPTADDVATLVDQLDHHRWLVRQATLRALKTVAEADPELVTAREDALVGRWSDEGVDDGHLLLLQVLAEVVPHADDPGAVVEIALAEATGERTALDVTATKVLAWAAMEDASLLAEDVDVLADLVAGLDDDAAMNAAIAIDEVAVWDASAVEPHADRLRALAEEVGPETAEYLEQTGAALAEAGANGA